jgi:diadenosine tetraphosphate (Ap4A) HIT family hydrolase
MTNATMRKFGFPNTVIRGFEHWTVLLRPAQVTLGSLVLAANGETEAFADLPEQAFAELATVIPAIEKALQGFCAYERINYLMLMMVDRHVHFHVIPRYSTPRNWNGLAFPDAGWPATPDLKVVVNLDAKSVESLTAELKTLF